MATNYSDLYSEIRAACGDHGTLKNGSIDTDSYMFRDAVIDGAITLALRDIDGFSASGTTITPDLSDDLDYSIVIYYAAVLLLLDLTDELMSSGGLLIRQAAPIRKLEFCAVTLNRLLEEKGVSGSYDGSLKQILNHGTRWANRIKAVAGTG